MSKSFTLIEILVVIIVIGVLSAFILVGMSSISDKANIAKNQSFSNSLRNSLLMGLVSEWKLDENTNDSWNQNNGTLYNFSASPYVSSCPSGQCLQFDGIDDYVGILDNDNLDIIKEITIEAWVNLQEVTGGYAGRVIVSKGSTYTTPYGIWTGQSANSIMAMITIGGVNLYDSTSNVNLKNGWHLIGEIYDGSKLYSIYDGRIFYIKDVTGDMDINGNSLTISSTSTDRTIKGMVDMVRIYNKAYRSSQIQQNYYSGLNKLLIKNSMSKEEYRLNLAQSLDQNAKF
jgi:prepilin-type N-terminal cleavage/methylation domain-containing protein